MPENYIDNDKRKKLVAVWIPVCLAFLHLWATALVMAAVMGKTNNTIDGMFTTCGWGIFGLIVMLISDKAIELVISRAGGIVAGQVVEKTTTETTVVKPAAPVTEMNVQAENVNVKPS